MNEIIRIVDREGLLGLHRAGLWYSPACLYFGTAVQVYWESCHLPTLFLGAT